MNDELLQLQAARDQLEGRLAVLEHALDEQKSSGGSAPESVDLAQALLVQLRVVNDRLAELRGRTASP
jgi:hypothetical protein